MDSTRHTRRYAVLRGVLDSPSYSSEFILPVQPPSSICDHNLLPVRQYSNLSQVLQITQSAFLFSIMVLNKIHYE